jgi:glycerol-3-phosphate dehydrogenase
VTIITREPAEAARQGYDLIVIGGGIYGSMLSREAALRGLRVLLLERKDFGGYTSFNSLRIIHGGLRYLQNLDIHRFRESVSERRWFLKNFANLVKPLACLMPLYSKGLRRPAIMGLALMANGFLSRNRNDGVSPENRLPSGGILDKDATKALFPLVDRKDLSGGAVWYDAFMPNSQRVIVQTLRQACSYGATSLNYVEACDLLTHKGRVVGVGARDRETGSSWEYRAPVVINAAGPQCRELASRFDKDEPALFRNSLAWNVFVDRESLSTHALAVAPPKNGGRVYFIVPWKGKMLIGTGHAPRNGSRDNPAPTNEEFGAFLSDINQAVPSLKIQRNDILFILSGYLPVVRNGTVKLATREFIFSHGDHGGPKGLFSVSGVKFTTSRLVAERCLALAFCEKRPLCSGKTGPSELPGPKPASQHVDLDWSLLETGTAWRDLLEPIVKEESVQHLDDLFFRRTTLWVDRLKTMELAPRVCCLFPAWDARRKKQEIERVSNSFRLVRASLLEEPE